MTQALVQFLNDAYRSKSRAINGSVRIQVDDRGADDIYDGFCDIWVSVPAAEAVATDTTSFTLELDQAPHNAEVAELIGKLGGQIHRSTLGARIRLTLTASDAATLKSLAKAFRRVIARGQHYPDPNWKWVARRTAETLDKFASHVATFKRQRRSANRSNM